MIVKRLLKKYRYPPEGQEDALKTVISQCELWTDNVAEFTISKPLQYSTADSFGSAQAAEKNLEYN